MSLSKRRRRITRIVVILNLVSAAISAVFGYQMSPETPLRAIATGIASSLAIATPISLFEVQYQHVGLFRRLRRLPLLAYFAIRVLLYLTVIVLGLLLVRLVFGTTSEPMQHTEITGVFVSGHSLGGAATERSLSRNLFGDTFFKSIVFGAIMSVLTNVVVEVGGLLGFGTLKNLLTGRYVQPRREQKAFLLIDMKDSTGLAERLGPIRFHELLNAFFRDVAEAALESGAEIHKYVGDEAILTWPAAALGDGEALACPFLARRLIEAGRAHYQRDFGTVPEFRAALHCGEIVAGEIGDVRREIAYVGDTLNVAARLLEAAKERGDDVLVSDDVLRRATLPAGLEAVPLPTLTVRGRAAPLAISALRPLTGRA